MGAMLVVCGASSLCECAACCGLTICSALMNWGLSKVRRLAHFLIVVFTFAVALVVGEYYNANDLNGYSTLTKIDLTRGCSSSFLDECIRRQLLYRASLALFLLFSFLGPLSWFSSLADRSFWPLKYIAPLAIFAAFLWSENTAFSQFAEAARVFSFFWLLIQGLLVLEVGHGVHDKIMQAAANEDTKTNGDSRVYLALYLGLSVGLLACAIVGLVYLFQDYSACELGRTLTTTTLVVGIISTLISLLQVVNKGLLTPSFMFAYSVLICWYALSSSNDVGCNPYAAVNSSPSTKASVVIITLISCAVLLFCVCFGSEILTIFNPNGEALLSDRSSDLEVILVSGNQRKSGERVKSAKLPYTDSDSPDNKDDDEQDEKLGQESGVDTPQERLFFHTLMALVSAYFGMVLTSWGSTDGSPEISSKNNESLWLKIVSQWVFLLLYFKTLHAAYISR